MTISNQLIKKILFAVITALFLVSSSASIAMSDIPKTKEYQWRYKVIVEIDTPEGIKSGFAVREMNIVFEPRPMYRPEPYNVSVKMKGEAVAVDLGERGVVFALISSDSYREVTGTFSGPPALTTKGAEYYRNLKNRAAPVKVNRPRIVHFKDISEPKSVELVYSQVMGTYKGQVERTIDNFEEIFGADVRLKNITVEMTDEPVNWSISDRYLPWLPNYYDKRLDGNRFGTINSMNKTANALSSGAFSTGVQK